MSLNDKVSIHNISLYTDALDSVTHNHRSNTLKQNRVYCKMAWNVGTNICALKNCPISVKKHLNATKLVLMPYFSLKKILFSEHNRRVSMFCLGVSLRFESP